MGIHEWSLHLCKKCNSEDIEITDNGRQCLSCGATEATPMKTGWLQPPMMKGICVCGTQIPFFSSTCLRCMEKIASEVPRR